MSIPIIRLEIEGMRHAIVAAVGKHLAEMDSDIQVAIENICTPEHVTDIIKKTASAEIDAAIKSEIEQFYRYGPGREVIKKAVHETLDGKLE